MAGITLAALGVSAAPAESDAIFTPTVDIYGMFRARAEVSTETGDQRFSVRTGRVGVMGNISRVISYKAELDLCDRGVVKVTDVWGRITVGRGFAIQAGQMRMPFSYGSARAPWAYLFADRPFVDKQFIGPRNAGIKGIYNSKAGVTVEGGVFNSTSLTNHAVWQSALAYAAKVLWTVRHVQMITGFESLRPGEVRINHFDAGLTWRSGRWMAEGEYIYKHYTHRRFDPAHAYNFMADYALPLRTRDFNRLSFQARWDGHTDNSAGTTLGEDGLLTLTDPACDRITVGSTISYVQSKVKADIKLNYQHYFYRDGAEHSTSAGNMVIAELVIRF